MHENSRRVIQKSINFLAYQPDRINDRTIQIFNDFTCGVEVVIMIIRKKERSKQNFILIMNHPLISSVSSNGVSKYLEDIRIIILYFEMNFEYKVITEVAGQYNTGNGLFSLQDLGKQHYNKHRPPYFSVLYRKLHCQWIKSLSPALQSYRKFWKKSAHSSWLTLHRKIDKTSAVPHTSVLGYYAHFLHHI